MRVKITDSAPGSGPARDTYLEARLRRVFEPYAPHLDGVELTVDYEGVLHETALVLRPRGASPAMFRSKSRRMVNALANLLDAAEGRLGITYPSARPRDEAM